MWCVMRTALRAVGDLQRTGRFLVADLAVYTLRCSTVDVYVVGQARIRWVGV